MNCLFHFLITGVMAASHVDRTGDSQKEPNQDYTEDASALAEAFKSVG